MRISEKRFYQRLQESQAGQEYLNLIEFAKERQNEGISVEGKENRHHIHPIGMQGSREKANTVILSEFEHCKAHALLAQIWNNKFEAVRPISKLNYGQFTGLLPEQQEILIEEFHWKELLQKALHFGLPPQALQRISKKTRGRKQSPEEIASRSESRRKLHNGNWYSEESIKKKSLSAKGQTWSSERREKCRANAKLRWENPEYRRKMSKMMSDRRRGTTLSKETKEKLSQIRKDHPTGCCSPEFKFSEEQLLRKRQKCSAKLRGRKNERGANSVWVTDGISNKRPLKEEAYLWIEKGWTYGKTDKRK